MKKLQEMTVGQTTVMAANGGDKFQHFIEDLKKKYGPAKMAVGDNGRGRRFAKIKNKEIFVKIFRELGWKKWKGDKWHDPEQSVVMTKKNWLATYDIEGNFLTFHNASEEY